MVTSPVAAPDGDPIWQGRELVAVIAWSPGHWVSYVCNNGVWWSMDTTGVGVMEADPFQLQSPNHTINFLAFKNRSQTGL